MRFKLKPSEKHPDKEEDKVVTITKEITDHQDEKMKQRNSCADAAASLIDENANFKDSKQDNSNLSGISTLVVPSHIELYSDKEKEIDGFVEGRSLGKSVNEMAPCIIYTVLLNLSWYCMPIITSSVLVLISRLKVLTTLDRLLIYCRHFNNLT